MRNLMIALLLAGCFAAAGQEKNDTWLDSLLRSHASPLLKKVLDHSDSFQYQIIYTEINRDRRNRPVFINHYLHIDRSHYFNPASTVKLPTALVALEKLNSLRSKHIDRNTPMLTDSGYSRQTIVHSDTSSESGLPSIANYIRKIFLVSDNDAYNRLYEFDGQEQLNRSLWQKGYSDVRITRRFVGMNEEENRHTNPIRFVNGSDTLRLAGQTASLPFDFSKKILVGKGHWDGNDSLINEPMDFSRHNNLPLEDLRRMLQSALFPGSVPKKERFDISEDDRHFLLNCMSEYPFESSHPRYDTSEFFSSYTKFFLYKADRLTPPPNIRIFNKPGWSFGYLTDASYIVDFDSGTEFMLSAVIYTNRDEILNDNRYEYSETGYPFFRELGQIIYNYDRNRTR